MLMVNLHCRISICSGFIARLVYENTPHAALEQPAEGCTSELEVSSNISLSKRQLKKSPTTAIAVRTNGPWVPGDVRPINSERMNTAEGLFLAEQAKGRTGDK